MIVLVRSFGDCFLRDLEQSAFFSWNGQTEFFPLPRVTLEWFRQAYPLTAKKLDDHGFVSLSRTELESLEAHLAKTPRDSGVKPVLYQFTEGSFRLSASPYPFLLDLNRYPRLDNHGAVEVVALPDSVCQFIQAQLPSAWQELLDQGRVAITPEQSEAVKMLIKATKWGGFLGANAIQASREEM